MPHAPLEDIRARIERLLARVDAQEAGREEWTAMLDDGRPRRYVVDGIKPLRVYEDEIATLFVWTWSLKDYLAKHATQCGRTSQWFDGQIAASEPLKLCADVANALKHGGYRQGWTGRHPRLGSAERRVPQQSIGLILMDADSINMQLRNTESTVVRVPIVDSTGTTLADARTTLESAISAWEAIAGALR